MVDYISFYTNVDYEASEQCNPWTALAEVAIQPDT